MTPDDVTPERLREVAARLDNLPAETHHAIPLLHQAAALLRAVADPPQDSTFGYGGHAVLIRPQWLLEITNPAGNTGQFGTYSTRDQATKAAHGILNDADGFLHIDPAGEVRFR